MKKFLLLLLIIFASLFLSQSVLAQVDVGLNYGEAVGIGNTDPRDMAVNIIRIALGFLGLIAVVVILYAGWLWTTSGGEPAKIDKAKKVLINGFIGLIIVLMAFGITQFVISRFLVATGGACSPGDSRNCGCGNLSVQSCNAGGTWDPCPPACTGATPCCCAGGTMCDVCPCPATPSYFTINIFSPANTATNVIRNKVVRVTFSHNIDNTTVQGNFRLMKTAGTGILPDGANCGGDPFMCASDRCDIAGSGNCIGNVVASSTLSVGGKRITFVPFTDCPAPYSALKCFDANATYTIEANFAGSIQRAGDGANLTCGPPPCSATFDTGAIIDTQNPSNLNMGSIGNLCIDTANTINSSANDDTGVDYFDYFDSFVGNFDTYNTVAGDCSGATPNFLCVGAGIWNPTTAGGYVAGNTYTLRMDVMDRDSNMSSINRNITLRPDHCCNGILDGDEDGVDCGGSCAGCAGAACGASLSDDCGVSGTNCSANNDMCVSGFCDCIDPVAMSLPYDCQSRGYGTGITECCLCQNAPIIDWITPWGGFCRDASGNPTNTSCSRDSDCPSANCDARTGNGAGGNLITIGGRYFGTATGTVEFANGAGWTGANLAYDVNNYCIESWSDTQIIAEVPTSGIPAAISTTTIRVTEATSGNNYTDTTAVDGRGPQVDFIINSIPRPGLCRLDPNYGRNGDMLDYYGINTNGSTAYFGSPSNGLEAVTSNFPSGPPPPDGTAQVPAIQPGWTTTYVTSVADVASNFLRFRKDEEASIGPRITGFDPLDGNVGQYVTIYGEGFGRARLSQIGSTHNVYFDLDVSDNTTPANYGTPGDFNFPNICANGLWLDNQIIVKVPAGLVNLSNYYIVVDTPGLSDPIDSSGLIPTAQVSPTFQYDNTAALSPSLCHISPSMGPPASMVSLYGEYFDAQDINSIVRFNYNADSPNIVTWNESSNPNRIEAEVPTNAATGPVRVLKSAAALEGNGIVFRVGNCSADADCGSGNVCCPLGSSEEGRCEVEVAGDSYANCYIDVDTSVYEWDFSTGVGPQVGDPCYDAIDAPLCNPIGAVDCSLSGLVCDPASCSCQPASVATCQGFGSGQCANNFCPNSPGSCSYYPGGNPLVTGSCTDSVCDGLGGVCTVPPCSYNSTLNRCDNGAVCDLPRTVLDALGNSTNASCEYYVPTANGRWFITTSASCPVGWTSVGGGRCVEDVSTCNYCDSGFRCFNDSGSGVCAIDNTICPTGSTCMAGSCERNDNENCECCCRIGAAFVGLDCCAPLECAGDCGADADAVAKGLPDPDNYGYCTGCADAGTTQADHDLACNCTGTTGKYCDSSDPRYPSGVCRDCAQLSTSTECSLHTATCCVDNMNSDLCRGGAGDQGLIVGDTPDLAYCSYYDCNSIAPYDCLGPALTGTYRTSNCNNSCSAPLPIGGGSCYTPGTGLCDIACGSGTTCLGDNGCIDDIAAFPVGCGSTGNANDCRCCCNPALDQCGAINPKLTCSPDKAPCDTGFRGLCCGCTDDSDCVAAPGVPVNVGCGLDTCCHQRSFITSNIPSGAGICRNPLIRVEFNEPMDPSSFSGNVYLVGDYGGVCPSGTTYLVQEEVNTRTGLARVFSEIALSVRRLIQPITRVATAQMVNCAVPGSVRGYNSGSTGILTFSPTIVLDANTTYYAIIRGDSDLSDTVNNGVLNIYGIGYNGPANPVFNNITYNNSFTWSFVTGAEICTLDYVVQDPASWLFNTSVDDPSDNPVASPLYDTVYDSDKVFYVYPKTSGGQDVVGIPGVYDWDWSWTSDNTGVAQVTNTNDPIQTVTAQHRQDAKTFVRARATIVDDTINDPSTVNSFKAGRSHVYVFLCENPWPPRDPVSGSWSPWLDDTFNCTDPVSGCNIDNHFELYYCRDAGGVGPADDLPSIASSSTIIRGMSATSSILKEFFFFREAAPEATNTLMVVDMTTGGSVQAAWPAVAGIDGYRLYYGVNPRDYSEYIDLDPASTTVIIPGLSNNINYYFAFTSYFLTGAESDYSAEVSVKPTDQTAPPTPTNLVGTAGNGQAGLTWDANTDADTDGYKVYIGTATGLYGTYQEVGDKNTVVVKGLTNGVRYYFVVTALDRYDNESGNSNEVFADVDALAALPSSGGTAVLTWSASGPVGEYYMYYEEIP